MSFMSVVVLSKIASKSMSDVTEIWRGLFVEPSLQLIKSYPASGVAVNVITVTTRITDNR